MRTGLQHGAQPTEPCRPLQYSCIQNAHWLSGAADVTQTKLTLKSRGPTRTPGQTQSSCSSVPLPCRWCTRRHHTPQQTYKLEKPGWGEVQRTNDMQKKQWFILFLIWWNISSNKCYFSWLLQMNLITFKVIYFLEYRARHKYYTQQIKSRLWRWGYCWKYYCNGLSYKQRVTKIRKAGDV